jgi:1-deoxy-D-xylulose-5-phosphate reductoisomerase
LPIQYALAYPERWDGSLPPLDLTRAGTLTFEQADTARFPCLDLAFRALSGESGLPIVLNAANEVAVAGFLDGSLSFTAIPEVITAAMDWYDASGRREIRTLADVRGVDGEARMVAAGHARGLRSKVL